MLKPSSINSASSPNLSLSLLLLADSDSSSASDRDDIRTGVTTLRWWILLQCLPVTCSSLIHCKSRHGAQFLHFRYSLLTFNQEHLLETPFASPRLTIFYVSYGISEEVLQLFVNYGSIFFCLLSVPVAMLMDTPNGFRTAMLSSAFFVLLGCVLRLCARDASFGSIILLHFSYISNAFAGPIAVSAPSLLANAWFPANERGLATGVAVAFNTFGLVFSYFCGPLFVAAGTIQGLMVYMYLCLALAAVNLLAIAFYFPSAPLLPPSRSAGVYAMTNQTYSLADAKALVLTCARNRIFVILTLAYGVISGLYSGWSALESPNLGSFGISQNDAGYISGSSIAAAALGTIILGVVADKKKDHKRTLSLLLILGLMGIIAWSLMLQAVVPLPADRAPRIGQLSALSVVIAIGFYSTTPIFFEAAVEASHPLPQGSVIMLMTFIFNAFSIVILAVPAQSSLFNWLLSGSSFLILILLLLFYQNQDRRALLDA